jgi:transcriptional regulator with XRE-family HTH domain
MIDNCQVIAYNKISNGGQNFCKLLATVSENLSALVQRRLKELKISKAELARKTGLSRTYITDIANATGNTQSGQYRPSPETLEKLAKHLEVSSEEILNSIGYETSDDELVADGLFSGYYDLSDERRELARKQIAAIISTLKDEDFPE